MAELLASGPPLVFAAIKEVVREAEGEKFQDTMNKVTRRQLRTVDTLYGSEDNLEGFRAFCGKARSGLEGQVALFRQQIRSRCASGSPARTPGAPMT
jgi:hypothetical protein